VSTALSSFIRRLRGSIGATQAGALSDMQLLERWLTLRDEAAFEVLLWRHGPMILGVCRRLLNNTADVENAFQATFLLLVRKAAAIRQRQSVGAWLYQVAYRVALRARQSSARRSARETGGVDELTDNAADNILSRDLRQILDEEINQLPAKYRAPFVRCHLEGCTNEEAALEMQCPVGTIHSRLAWARERLRSRLMRRGVTLTAAGLTAVAAHGVASAALAENTLQAAFAHAAHPATAAGCNAAAVALTKGVLRTMLLSKLKQGVAVALALALCGGAGGLVFYGVAEASGSHRSSTSLPSAPVSEPGPAAQVGHAAEPRTIKVPSEVSGRLLGVFTEIGPNDKPAQKDLIMAGNQKYQRLREGDTVKEGQLLARVDDILARDEVDFRRAKVDTAEAEIQTTVKTKDEAANRYNNMIAANKRVLNAYSPEDVSGAKLTWDRYVLEELAKKADVVAAKAQLNQVMNRLKMYEIRSPVDGVIKTIHVRKGEAVKQYDTVLEILPTDDDK
jgi:RNA polymerase sigma factor (sigma-70 family)